MAPTSRFSRGARVSSAGAVAAPIARLLPSLWGSQRQSLQNQRAANRDSFPASRRIPRSPACSGEPDPSNTGRPSSRSGPAWMALVSSREAGRISPPHNEHRRLMPALKLVSTRSAIERRLIRISPGSRRDRRAIQLGLSGLAHLRNWRLASRCQATPGRP